MIFSCFRINHSFNPRLKDKLLPLVLGTFLLTALSLGHAGTPQTLTFPPIADRVTPDAACPLSAPASSGLSVTYSIVSPAGGASLDGGPVTLSGTAGTVTVKASQAGNGTYDPAPDVYQSFVVGTASQKFAKLAVNAHGIHELVIKPDGTLWG